MKCPALEIADPHLRVLALNNSFQVRCTILDARLRDFPPTIGLFLQGSARFLCPFGYRLVGRGVIGCDYDGAWDGEVPTCKGERAGAQLNTL